MELPKNILFLCVANSARSQMAEGLARQMFPDLNIRSAGSAPTKPNPFAIQAMSELDIDISSHTSDSVNDVDPTSVDLVITLCEDEVCPVFLDEAPQLHWPFKDPDRKNEDLTDEERLEFFRQIRDQIKSRLRLLTIQATGLAPILSSRDVGAALHRYGSMGFLVNGWTNPEGETTYGFVCMGEQEFHIGLRNDMDPDKERPSAYIYVTDVQTLYDVWNGMDLDGKLFAPEEMAWGMLEMEYVDPDNNVLRIGTPLDAV